MEPSYGGHNYPSYMPEMYHAHNSQAPVPTPMVGSRSTPTPWQHLAMHQHDFVMPGNSMEDKKSWSHIASVGDPARIAPAKDGDKQASKRSRANAPDEHPSETSSTGENGAGGGYNSTGNVNRAGLPIWELASVLGSDAASLYGGRRASSAGADRGRGDVDLLVGSKESSESQDENEDYSEEGDDKSKDKTSKQQMNRKAAQLSRRRKKERISELEQSVIRLSRKNHELKVINEMLRVLLQKRSQQQSANEHRIMQLLRTKNTQLKHALADLQNHSARGNSELPRELVLQTAALLGPDFQFQHLGAVPPMAAPSTTTPSNAFMGMMPQQFGGGGVFSGMEGLGSLPPESSYPHALPQQNRSMGMNVPPMMLPHQMPGGMDMGMGMGSFLRPSHGNQPLRHDMEYTPMGMNRMSSDQQDLPGIVQTTKL